MTTRWMVVGISLLALAGCSDVIGDGGIDASVELQMVDAPDALDVAADTWTTVAPHKESRGPYTVVWLSGTPYEMGKQQGEMLEDTIKEAMEFVMADPLLSSIPELAVQLGIYDILAAVSFTDILDECQGIVDGAPDSGLTLELCVILNCGDVLLHLLYVGIPEDAPEGPGCSGVVATGPATKDGRMLHSRNLDWGGMNIDIIYHNPVVFVRQPADGIPHVIVGFPMDLTAYTGMNTEGIAFGTHAADPAGLEEMSGMGRSHVQSTSQMLKSARSLDDVEAFLKDQGHMTAGILVASDGSSGTGAVFDMTATGIGIRRTDDAGMVYGTNHFESEAMKDKDDEGGPGSQKRWDRFKQLLDPEGAETVYGDIDHQALAKVMRDVTDPWTGKEYTLAEIEATGYDTDGTLGANAPMHLALFEPERLLFWVAAGEPPVHTRPSMCFSLEELLGYEDPAPCVPVEL